MIAADDPRHGTNRGYIAGCGEVCCRTAHADYRRDLRTRQYLNRGPLTTTALGTRRRLQALVRMGWCLQWIDVELGRKVSYCQHILSRDPEQRILVTTANEIAAVYERLAMRLPDDSTSGRRNVATRVRNKATRLGWLPPLAWDDIDNDPAPPTAKSEVPWEDQIDDAVVRRVLDTGTRPRILTRAEAEEVARALYARGLSSFELERDYGLKSDRYSHVRGRVA